ncbi:Solute carrier family 25 member 40 [Pleurostoma richardsiae]|uniref:Solute carrier family 25 member 40 n=1 Tax=Pleurostoma richardsiae TaxID=41990 RepID=A0AA38VGT7_9PEZI|nr:Solute carrier family 25 member 40 [Pleurostoma richardsiae]
MATLARTSGGQDHERISPDDSFSLPNMLPTDHEGDSEPIEITAFQKMLSATTGSLLTGLLVTPLDVVRVRWQAQGVKQTEPPKISPEFSKLTLRNPDGFRPSNLGVTACCREVFFMNNNAEYCLAGPRIDSGVSSAASAAAECCAVEQTQQKTFNSTIDGLRKIARNEGFFTLWRGLSPTLVMAIPGNMIYFTGYEWLRFNKKSPINRTFNDQTAPLVAGVVARVLAAASVGPIELFRTRLQASHGDTAAGHVKDTIHSIREMVHVDGYRSLWRGLTLTLWRDVPFSGMYWWGYEMVRGRLTDAREQRRGREIESDGSIGRHRRRSQSRENHRDTFMDSFIAGGLSGAFASIATMPFDVGKTRTQVYRHSGKKSAVDAAGKAAAAPEENSMVQLLWHIFRTEGVAGLFKGWIPRTLKVAPACAIMISSYEVGKKVFRGVNERALRKEMEHERAR